MKCPFKKIITIDNTDIRGKITTIDFGECDDVNCAAAATTICLGSCGTRIKEFDHCKLMEGKKDVQ
jgi:hypothetical protein